MFTIENKLLLNSLRLLLVILLIPIIGILINVISAYGYLFGSFARYIMENKVCI